MRSTDDYQQDMTRDLIIEKIRTQKEWLARSFHISRIGLFGSYAVGAPTDESDVDLIYELKDGKRLGYKDVFELEHYLKHLLNIDKVDLVNQRYVNPIIEDEIQKTVIYV